MSILDLEMDLVLVVVNLSPQRPHLFIVITIILHIDLISIFSTFAPWPIFMSRFVGLATSNHG